MTYLANFFNVNFDAPVAWGIYFQDSATPQMEGLVELHDNIMYYLVMILFAVAWILLSIIRNYVETKSPISLVGGIGKISLMGGHISKFRRTPKASDT